MKFISRAQWGARTPTNTHDSIRSNRGVKIHYLGSHYRTGDHSTCYTYIRNLQRYYMDTKGWADIAYNLCVCEHGHVFEGRGAGAQNAANGRTSLNRDHYAVIAFVGSSGHTKPTSAQVQGVRDAVAYLRERGGAGHEIRGHRDGYATACPGDELYRLVTAGELEPDRGDSSSGTYTVRHGDTLSQIGARLGIRWQSIAAANGIRSPYTIYPGQRLTIPRRTYTVRSGDSLSAIGDRLGVAWQDIARTNNIRSPYLIHPGQVLTIP